MEKPGVAGPELTAEIAEKVEAFVSEVVVPYENDPRRDHHDCPSEELVAELKEKARAAGVLTPHILADGRHLTQRETAVVLRASDLSPLGPLAVNTAAPDEGNIYLLGKVGSPAIKERFLKPLVEGRGRSAFFMAEPAAENGAGSDPSIRVEHDPNTVPSSMIGDNAVVAIDAQVRFAPAALRIHDFEEFDQFVHKKVDARLARERGGRLGKLDDQGRDARCADAGGGLLRCDGGRLWRRRQYDCRAGVAGNPRLLHLTRFHRSPKVDPSYEEQARPEGRTRALTPQHYGFQTMCEGGGIANVTILEAL
jgi:hypothetical protein